MTQGRGSSAEDPLTRFRRSSTAVARVVLERIRRKAPALGNVRIMDFCGTHEWTITHYGIRSLMPENIELVAGPGCPVCVTPAYYVNEAIRLALDGVRVYTFGDAYKLPGRAGTVPRTLEAAAAEGGDVAVVYSFLDAVRRARAEGKESVFFAVGFETTMPSTASPIAAGALPPNLRVLSAHRYTPPIVVHLLERVEGARMDGVIAPGHVSAVIGSEAWRFLPRDYGIPTVVAGFEAVDVLIAIDAILEMLVRRRPALINEYRRVVRPEGNPAAKRVMEEVFEPFDAYWRGIGVVPSSGARLREAYAAHDAAREYGIKDPPDDVEGEILPGCRCHEVVLGMAKPTDCPLFMKACTPDTPYGPCMVSMEGTCRIWSLNLAQVGQLLRRG